MTPLTRALPDDLQLQQGAHPSAEVGMCVMEAVAFVAGEPFSDQPVCACPVISTFLRAWNDALPDDETRTRLLAPFVARLVDSKSTREVELKRSWLAFDWLVREQAPAWLMLTDALRAHGEALRQQAPLVSVQRVDQSAAARDAAWAAARAAARDAAWAAAWDAAWAAAWDVARDAAWDAAWDAARDAARDAAWDVARDAAWAAARDAAWAAAWDAAWDAARDAAWAAAWDAAWDAARDAVRNKLTPVVESLQRSALVLVDRMLAVTPDTTDADLDALCDWSVRS